MAIHYRVAGDGPPLLLLHGAAEDAELLAPQADAFAAEGYRVITYDRRGTGLSTRAGWPDGGVALHIADAASLIADVAGAPATVLGFSSGGVLALGAGRGASGAGLGGHRLGSPGSGDAARRARSARPTGGPDGGVPEHSPSGLGLGPSTS